MIWAPSWARFEGLVVAGYSASFIIIPVSDGMHWRILGGPVPDGFLQFEGNLVEGHRRIAAVVANQAGFEGIAGEQGQQRGATATGFGESRRGRDQSFQPNLTFVSPPARQPVGADQGM
jgi:hypothetical protein